MGKGAVSDDDPRSLMTIDSGEHNEAGDAIALADLVITGGYDIAEHDPADWHHDKETATVHIDRQPAEVYEAYNPEAVADIAVTLRELADLCEGVELSFEMDWYTDLREQILGDGQPAHRAILACADEHDVDCIVMGTYGRTGWDRYLLGGVTERVVRLTDIPVISVKERS